MDQYMLIIYVTINQEEAIRKLFYKHGWKYYKEDGDITIVRGDELTNPISSDDVEHVNSSDLNSFNFEVPCSERDSILRPDVVSSEDQNGSIENQEKVIAYNDLETNLNSNSDYRTQQRVNLIDILDDKQVNDKSNDSLNDIQNSFDESDHKEFNVSGNVEDCVVSIYQDKDFEEGYRDDSVTKCKQACENELITRANDEHDDGVDKLETKHEGSVPSDINEKDQSSVSHLISRGKLLSIENRTRLKKGRTTLRPKKKPRKASNINRSKKVPIFCCDCKVTFTSQKRYDKHKERNDGQCVFPCQFCDKVFLYRKSRYDLHMRSAHSKERPFKCDVCEKGYVTSDKLKIHKRVHTGERPCVCEECGKAFYSRGDLSTHREYHHISKERQDNLVCDLCNMTFCNQRYLTYHKNVTHSSRRDFHCQTCSKSFKSNSSLKRHLKYIHSEIKSFQCDTCDKCFKTAGSLKKHKVRHGGERTFFCSECSKGFYEKGKLEQHIRTHTGEKPYQCHLCEYKCALSGNLSKHMKTHYRELTNAVF